MDIGTIRLAWASFVCWFIILFLAITVASGMARGRIQILGASPAYSRKKDPARYWALMATDLALIFLIFFAWLKYMTL